MLWVCRTAVVLWGVMFSYVETSKLVMNELIRVLDNWPQHETSTADGNNVVVCSLAVSFWMKPCLPPVLPLWMSSPTATSLCLVVGCKPGFGAGFGTGQV